MAERRASAPTRGNNWADEEVMLLISIWKESGIQQMMDGTSRDSLVYRTLAEKAIMKKGEEAPLVQ